MECDYKLDYCILLGGAGDNREFGIAVDPAGAAYGISWTASTDSPRLAALQSRSGGEKAAFIVKVNSAGVVVFNRYLGETGSDAGNAVAVDTWKNSAVRDHRLGRHYGGEPPRAGNP
jgi:hypothetical protein